MNTNSYFVLWNLLLLFYFVFSLLFGLYFIALEEYIYYAIASLPIMLLSMLFCRGSLIDPRVWFAVFGWLYSFSKAVLTWGGQYSVDVSISYESAYLNYIFYCFTVFSLWVFAFLLRSDRDVKKESFVDSKRVQLKLIVVVLCCFLIVDAVLIFSSGVTSKRMIADDGVGLPFIGILSNVLIVAYSLYVLAFSDQRLKGIVAFVGATLVLSYLLTGERDLVAKFVLCTSFALIYKERIRQRVVYVYGFFFVLLFVLMKDVTAYVLSRGDYEVSKFDGFKWALFKGDWASSGSNLEVLLSFKFMIAEASAGTAFLVNDIISGVLPFGSKLVETTGSWYANNFLYYSIGREIGGLGFSYLGNWYVYFGEFGAFLGGLVYAFITWFFYYKARKNVAVMAAYIAFTALAIWSLRVGFNGLLTSAINQSLLPLLLIFIFLKCVDFRSK